MHWLPIQSIVNAYHRDGMHTIGMDTDGLIAPGVAATGGRATGTIRPFRWWIRGKTAAGVVNPAPDGRRTTVKK